MDACQSRCMSELLSMRAIVNHEGAPCTQTKSYGPLTSPAFHYHEGPLRVRPPRCCGERLLLSSATSDSSPYQRESIAVTLASRRRTDPDQHSPYVPVLRRGFQPQIMSKQMRRSALLRVESGPEGHVRGSFGSEVRES